MAGARAGGPGRARPRPLRTSQPPGSAASASAALPAPSPTVTTAPAVQPSGPAPPGAACVSQVLGRLSLAQQVGQLFLVGVAGDVAGSQLTAAMRSYHFGSLLLTKSAAGTAALARQTTAMQ